MKKIMTTLVVAGAVGSAAVLGGAHFGWVNVAADDPHSPAVFAFLAMARDRSIAVRARDIEVPHLKDETLIRTGAGNYNAMCVSCHLAPGLEQTELSQALYPAPPNLSKRGAVDDPAAAFWTIKHGIKATGMPAWGKSMGDQYIWGLVAFLDELPQMNPEQYKTLVASSGGHQHGGGESDTHGHHGTDMAETDEDHHAKPQSKTHTHKDGKAHTHES